MEPPAPSAAAAGLGVLGRSPADGGAGAPATPSDGLLPVPVAFSVSTVIVTGLSPLATEQTLREFFKNCGNIVQLNLLGYQQHSSYCTRRSTHEPLKALLFFLIFFMNPFFLYNFTF